MNRLQSAVPTVCRIWTKQSGRALASMLAVVLMLSVNSRVQAQSWIEQADAASSRVVYDQRAESVTWVLPLGPIERIDGLWQPEKSRSFTGKLRRRTLEFSAENSTAKLYQGYQQALQQLRAQVLYSCRGRDCGQSNNWANRFFQVFQLFGREDSQRLGSYFWRADGFDHYAVLYLVRRGNQRIYLQQEWFSVASSEALAAVLPTTEQLLGQLKSDGLIRLNQSAGQLDQQARASAEWQALIVALLSQHPRLNVDLVAHHYDSADAKTKAEQMLQSWQQALAAGGVARSRWTSHNLANLAPIASRPESARLDILLR